MNYITRRPSQIWANPEKSRQQSQTSSGRQCTVLAWSGHDNALDMGHGAWGRGRGGMEHCVAVLDIFIWPARREAFSCIYLLLLTGALTLIEAGEGSGLLRLRLRLRLLLLDREKKKSACGENNCSGSQPGQPPPPTIWAWSSVLGTNERTRLVVAHSSIVIVCQRCDQEANRVHSYAIFRLRFPPPTPSSHPLPLSLS